MVLNIFVVLWCVLFLVFSMLAFSLKNMKVYLTGCLVSLVYFWGATEGLIYVFHHNIPIIGFLVNPFPGTYQFLMLNLKYNWYYFATALGLSLVLGVILLVRIKRAQREAVRPLSTMNVG